VGGAYLWAAHFWIDPFEEGYFAYLASRVAVGDQPYRDFATPYTPGFFYLHALIFQIFGYTLFWQRASVIVARVVGAGLLYLLARRLAPPRYAILAPVTFLLLDPAPVPWQTHPSWYAAPFATGAALAMVRYLDTRRWMYLGLAGVAAALSFAFKQNVGLLTLLALTSFAVLACPSPTDVPGCLLRWSSRLDRLLPGWFNRLPALGALFLVPLALTVALRGRPQIEYGLEFVLPLLLTNIWLYRQQPPAERDFPSRGSMNLGIVSLGFGLVTAPWLLGLILLITRHEVPLRQFVGGVDPAGYIVDQWWPHPEGLVSLMIGPAVLFACWQFARGHRLLGGILALATVAPVVCAFALTRVPGASILTSGASFGLLTTENVDQLIPALAAAVVTVACLSGWTRAGEARTVAWLVTFGVAMFFLQYPRMDEPHLIFSAPPMMAALAWFLSRAEARVLGTLPSRPGVILRSAIAVSLMLMPLLSLFPVTNWRWSMLVPPRGDSELRPHTYVPLESPRAGVLALPYVAQPLDAVVKELQEQTSPGEPIFVFPATPMIYYLADRPNATRYNHLLPGLMTLDEEHAVIQQIIDRSVRIVVFEPAFEFLWLRETDYPELRYFLRTEFELSSQIGPYEIWAIRK
jgi:hypothetical protein